MTLSLMALGAVLSACGSDLQRLPSAGGAHDSDSLTGGAASSCAQYEPGCGSDPIPAAGCYVPCSTDADCGTGEACEARSINPCVAANPGDITCEACGATVNLCVAASPPPPPPPPACTDYEPGCGDDPIPAAGCYVECSSDADCASGEACEARSIDPCAETTSGGLSCAACGMTVNLCVAATQPPPTGCTQFEPGCGGTPIPAAGCYQTCEVDADCLSGTHCYQRSINPCTGTGTVCQACGLEVGVCL